MGRNEAEKIVTASLLHTFSPRVTSVLSSWYYWSSGPIMSIGLVAIIVVTLIDAAESKILIRLSDDVQNTWSVLFPSFEPLTALDSPIFAIYHTLSRVSSVTSNSFFPF
jgi:hypothetical protein